MTPYRKLRSLISCWQILHTLHQSVVPGIIFNAAAYCRGTVREKETRRLDKLIGCRSCFGPVEMWNRAVAIATTNGIAIEDLASQGVLHLIDHQTVERQTGSTDQGSDSRYPHLHLPLLNFPPLHGLVVLCFDGNWLLSWTGCYSYWLGILPTNWQDFIVALWL